MFFNHFNAFFLSNWKPWLYTLQPSPPPFPETWRIPRPSVELFLLPFEAILERMHPLSFHQKTVLTHILSSSIRHHTQILKHRTMQPLLVDQQCRWLSFIKAASILLKKLWQDISVFAIGVSLALCLVQTFRANIYTIVYTIFPPLYLKGIFQQCCFTRPLRQQSKQYRISQVFL